MKLTGVRPALDRKIGFSIFRRPTLLAVLSCSPGADRGVETIDDEKRQVKVTSDT
jgi:hypothetical protein